MTWLVVLLAAAMAISHLVELAAIACAALEVRRQRRLGHTLLEEAAAGAGALPGVSAVVPVGNDDAEAIRAIDALLDVRYPDLELIAVLDSGSGNVLEALGERFDLHPADPRPRGDVPTEHVRAVFSTRRHPRLLVVDKRGADRADAWNAGLNFATRALVLTIEPGVTFDAHTLTGIVLPFAVDTTTIAAAATVRLAGRDGDRRTGVPLSIVGGLQHLRHLRRALGALSLNALDAQICAPPGFSLYARSALRRAGGFHPRTPEPGRELAIRLHALRDDERSPYRIVQSAVAVAHRPASERWKGLTGDEVASHRGSVLLFGLHGWGLTGRRPGALARLVPPLAALGLTMPAIEAVGWIALAIGLGLDVITWDIALLFISATLGLGLASSLATLLLDIVAFDALPSASAKARLVGLAVFEQLGPRQLLLWWRLRAWFGSRATTTATI